jgi:hypothetical protein
VYSIALLLDGNSIPPNERNSFGVNNCLYSKCSGHWKSFETGTFKRVQRNVLPLLYFCFLFLTMTCHVMFFLLFQYSWFYRIYIFIRHPENRITTKCFCVCCRCLIYGGIFHCWGRLSLQYKSCAWANGLLKGLGET